MVTDGTILGAYLSRNPRSSSTFVPKAPTFRGSSRLADMLRDIAAATSRQAGRPVRDGTSGQSVVEFALVMPMLLIVFIAIADFGRIFAASIAVEAATRNAAEAAANRYLSDKPGGVSLDQPAPPGSSSYYGPLHTFAAGVVCAELRDQPNTNYNSGTNTCPDMPVVMVCVHDSQDTDCATHASPGTAAIPPECTVFTPTPTPDQLGTKARWVEVRTCYHFTALLAIPLFSLGDFWLQRTNQFTIPCYFAVGTAECG
jgi:hypothetical protein